MRKHCVVAGCSSTHKDGVSLFSFPRDSRMRRLWIRQVQRTRAKWTATPSSSICSKHFSESSFESSSLLASIISQTNIYDLSCIILDKFEIEKRPKLKKDAVPTILNFSSEKTKATRSSMAYSRREADRVRNL
jgi:hypothetical protein